MIWHGRSGMDTDDQLPVSVLDCLIILSQHGAKMVESNSEQDLAEKQAGKGTLKVIKSLPANKAVLYTKLRNCHWNVTGVNFYILDAAFEVQFHEIAATSDDVAERTCARFEASNALSGGLATVETQSENAQNPVATPFSAEMNKL